MILFKLVKRALIIIGAIALFLMGLFFFIDDTDETTQTDKFIVANPVDLNQIASISLFRSCAGHDYSGKNAEGEKETLRSMKHYLEVTTELDQSSGKVAMFAPFDGKIESIDTKQGPRGNLVWISGSAGGWKFIFFHIDLVPGLKKGSEVEAGQLIGYANLVGGANFDYGLKRFGIRGQMFESPFKHMAPKVLAEYEAVGITPENIIATKAFRDNNPCPIKAGTESKYDTIFDNRRNITEDWKKLVN